MKTARDIAPADPYKAATRLDEVDLLRLQNLNLKFELLNKERAALGAALTAKYGDMPSVDLTTGAIER